MDQVPTCLYGVQAEFLEAVENEQMSLFLKTHHEEALKIRDSDRYVNTYVMLSACEADGPPVEDCSTKYLPNPVKMTVFGLHLWENSPLWCGAPLHYMLLGEDKRVYAFRDGTLSLVAEDARQLLLEGFNVRAEHRGPGYVADEPKPLTDEDSALRDGLLRAIELGVVGAYVEEHAGRKVHSSAPGGGYVELCGLEDTVCGPTQHSMWTYAFLPTEDLEFSVLGHYKWENMYDAYPCFIHIVLLASDKRIYSYIEDEMFYIARDLEQLMQEGLLVRGRYGLKLNLFSDSE